MKSDDFGPFEFILAGCIICGIGSLATSIIAGLWEHLPLLLKLLLVPPYFIAVFPLPCPLWYIWYADQPMHVKTVVRIAAVAWVAITIVCLVSFGKP